MKFTFVACAIGMAIMLAACGQSSPQVAYAPAQTEQQAPVYVQSAPVQQADNTGALVDGMILGSMMGGGSRTTVIHHYGYAPRPIYVRPAYVSRSYSYRRR